LEKYKRVVELWRSYKISSADDIDKYLDSFRILFAYNSGKIENEEITYHDTREIFENGKIVSYTGSTRSVFEQQNQKLCYEVLKDMIIDREPITVDLIREIHRILTCGTYDERRYIVNAERPGDFKRHEYVTGINEVGSSVNKVEEDIKELVSEVNKYEGKDVLKVAAYLHARFESIHPFADGNGRVGRTLTNYYLMTHDHPPLIIYDEDKFLYYECLQKYDETEDIDPLHEFLVYESEKTWEKTLALADNTGREHKGLEDFLGG